MTPEIIIAANAGPEPPIAINNRLNIESVREKMKGKKKKLQVIKKVSMK
ncbi:hypothetical protein GCM10025861_09520 [Methanobacterium petrolearium]|nr:hypothetical protein GCM10025861_09520 [Methanobacterium petrolearium]